MEFRVLLFGPVRLSVGGRHQEAGSPKEGLVLAALAWDAGRPVHIDTLIGRVWDDPPDRPRESVYAYVSRIRGAVRRLGRPGRTPLSGRAHTYTLEIDPGLVDARRYLELVDGARALAGAGDPHEVLRRLDEASRLRRGDPLTGVDGLWAEEVRGELARGEFAAASLRAGALLRLGRYADAVPLLAPLVERRPLDESLVELLALALYGAGRTADATLLLRATRRRLVRELGMDGGERLGRVQQGVVNRVPVTELLPPGRAARARADSRPSPDNLPGDVSWVGRRDEVDRLVAAATAAGPAPRVVALEAIDGMAGVGKTSLAVHVAHRLRDRFPDGRVHLELRGHDPSREPRDPRDALGELLRLFGVPADRLPRTLGELTAHWRTLMADRRAVVILDDAAGPEQVRPLLPGASPSLVVITSRRRLTGLADVRPLSLDVLPLPDAVALFRRRVGPDRPLGDEEAAEIVRLCGRLPLAVDIVASRFVSRPAWTAADLVRRLARSGGRLTEIRDAHRGITAVFEFSHRALTEVQRTAFRRLGLYIGSDFGLHAAAALTDMPVEDADRVLEDLLNCHLLVETSPHRYRMHDLLREFARALMADEAERRRAVDRLLGHYLHTADAADRVVYPHRVRMDVACGGTGPVPAGWSGRAESREWFTSEGRNLLAVLEHVRAHRPSGELAALSHVLAGFLEAEGYWATAEPVLRRAAEHWRSLGDPTAEARALLDLGAVCMRTGAYEAAIESAGRAARLARENGEPEVEAEALHQSGLAFWHSGRSLSALPRQKRALSLRMRGRNTLQQARSLNVMGIVLLHLGRTGESIELFREAVSGFRSADDSRGLYQALNNMGEAHRATGAERLAERCYREAVDLAGAAGSAVDRATLQMNLASFAMDSGRADEALLLYREALPVFHGVGDRRNESITHNGIGRALRSTGRRDEAVLWCRAALELARSIGASNEEVQALRELGLAEWEAGRERRAVELLEAGLSLARRIHAPGEEVKLEKTLDVLRVDHGSSASAKGRGKEPSVEGEAPG